MLPGTESEGFTGIYRQKSLKEMIGTPDPKIKTVRDVIKQCKDKYGDRPGIGNYLSNIRGDYCGNSG